MTFFITEKLEDGRAYVAVSNEKGEHLFCHVTADKARALLVQQHSCDSAAVFQDLRHAPELQIQVIPLELDTENMHPADLLAA